MAKQVCLGNKTPRSASGLQKCQYLLRVVWCFCKGGKQCIMFICISLCVARLILYCIALHEKEAMNMTGIGKVIRLSSS